MKYDIKLETSAIQWKSTSSMIECFVNIKEKHLSFRVFDIESSYLSMTERLLMNAIQFAKEITETSNYDMSFIKQSWKTLFFKEKLPLVKKDGSEDFDVAKVCFDGTEVCKLVETFILDKTKNVFQNNLFGLYRDDRLIVIKGLSEWDWETEEKRCWNIPRLWIKYYHWSLSHTVNYLHVTFAEKYISALQKSK